jgi:hypothetical protein
VPTGVVPLVVAMASTEQTEESAQEAPAVGMEQPGTTVTSSTETTRPVLGAAQPSVTTMPQTKVEVPTTDGSWPGVIATPQEETAWFEPSAAQVTASEAWQT